MANSVFKQNNNNYAIAYYRFSSHSQNEASIDQQREQTQLYAETHDLNIIKEYTDRAISGTTDERPGFQQMLAEVSKLKPAVLILWKTDRLGRDRYTLALAKKTIRDAGCSISYIAEAIPDDSPESVLTERVCWNLWQNFIQSSYVKMLCVECVIMQRMPFIMVIRR